MGEIYNSMKSLYPTSFHFFNLLILEAHINGCTYVELFFLFPTFTLFGIVLIFQYSIEFWYLLSLDFIHLWSQSVWFSFPHVSTVFACFDTANLKKEWEAFYLYLCLLQGNLYLLLEGLEDFPLNQSELSTFRYNSPISVSYRINFNSLCFFKRCKFLSRFQMHWFKNVYNIVQFILLYVCNIFLNLHIFSCVIFLILNVGYILIKLFT